MKKLYHLFALLIVTSLLAACAGAGTTSAPPAADEATAPSSEEGTDDSMAAADTDQMEAPMLAEMVASGDLPPLAERLPAEPLVIEPVESLGKYGGIWRQALVGGQDNAWLTRTISYEHLVRWTRQWTGIEPNIAKSFEGNAEGTEYTFELREGMKWSDGAPFSADDLLFWYEDIIGSDYENAHNIPSWLTSGGEPVVVEKIDDYTVVFKFAEPNGLFLQNIATPSGAELTRWPKHYCSQFHPDYNADNIDALIAEADANDWVNLMELKCGGVSGTPYDARWYNADLPTLMAWDITKSYADGSTQVVAERNPYYWKVDTEGRQLPYIDRAVYDILEDREVLLLKVLNGEIDMMSRHFNTNDNKAVLADNMDAGDFTFFETIGGGNTTGFHFNLNHKDERMREIFQDKNFRIAMSHCINRQEIIDVLYVGQGEPMNSAVGKEVPALYDEEMYELYTEYDVELAHEYLAEAGMTEQDGEGYFLGPDGEPFSFVVQATDSFGFSDRAEMVTNQWRACGINAQLQVIDRSLLYTRKDSNEHDVHVWGAGAGASIFLDPRHLFPYSAESTFAQAWVTWYTNPTGEGALTPPEEPPDVVKQQMELYDQIKATGDLDRQNELMREIIEIAKDQFYVIGISSSPPGYGVVRNNFKNVPMSMPGSWQYPTPAPTNPEQYWIDQ